MPCQLWVSASVLPAVAVDAFVASVACFLSREMQDGCSWESSAFCLTDTWAPTWLLLMLMPCVTPQHWSPLPPSSLGGVCLCHHFHSTICWHSIVASYPFIRVPNGKGISSPPLPLCFWHDLKLSGVFFTANLIQGLTVGGMGAELISLLDNFSLSSLPATFPSGQRAFYFSSLGDRNAVSSFLPILWIL